jgi:hypothetical protein
LEALKSFLLSDVTAHYFGHLAQEALQWHSCQTAADKKKTSTEHNLQVLKGHLYEFQFDAIFVYDLSAVIEACTCSDEVCQFSARVRKNNTGSSASQLQPNLKRGLRLAD